MDAQCVFDCERGPWPLFPCFTFLWVNTAQGMLCSRVVGEPEEHLKFSEGKPRGKMSSLFCLKCSKIINLPFCHLIYNEGNVQG